MVNEFGNIRRITSMLDVFTEAEQLRGKSVKMDFPYWKPALRETSLASHERDQGRLIAVAGHKLFRGKNP